MALATFVHISDLHFGDIDPTTFDAEVRRLWANCSWFDGFLGHAHRALEALDSFFHAMRIDEDAQLVVTGDVTAFGSQEQFATAAAYLGGLLVPPSGNFCGLRVGDWKDRGIPGNHDHWPGNGHVWGEPGPGLATAFPARPFVSDPMQLSTGHRLRFVGIDTDADVRPFGLQRRLALGSFASQLTDAATMLRMPEPNEIRVLLLHHSRACTGRTLRMATASRKALDDFLFEQDIAVMLCGHAHVPYIKAFPLTRKGHTVKVLEARSGTTTQRDTIPSEWRTYLGQQPNRTLPPNSLLVHRLLEQDGTLVWHAESFVRLPRGFVKSPTGPEERVTIWPH